MPHQIRRHQDMLLIVAKLATYQEYQQFIMELSIAFNNLREPQPVAMLDEQPVYPKP